jgi:hypothetical protein
MPIGVQDFKESSDPRHAARVVQSVSLPRKRGCLRAAQRGRRFETVIEGRGKGARIDDFTVDGGYIY